MYQLHYKVTTSTCDEQGRLKLFSALQMMQDCSELWVTSQPVLDDYYRRTGHTQLLASRQVDVLRRPVFGEDLTVRTTVWQVQPRFGYRNTVIADAQGHPCLTSWSMGAFVDRATGALAALPPEVAASVALEPRLDMDYRPRRIALPKCQPAVLAPFEVWPDYIDYNSHVNNAQYIRLALQCIPADFAVAGMRVEFKSPARLGHTLTPHLWTEPGRCVVQLMLPSQVSTIVEFTTSH